MQRSGANKVLFLFESGRSERTWRERFSKGEVADEYPYGLDPKKFDGWSISFARDYFTSGVWGILRRLLRKTAGTDFVHVLFNIAAIYEADVVISHTEDTCVAYLLLKRVFRNFPPIVAQVVWSGERERMNSSFDSRLARAGLRGAEVVVTHCSLNAEALSLWLGRPVQVAQYGIDPNPFEHDQIVTGAVESCDLIDKDRTPVIVCAGNDPQRDWDLIRRIAIRRRDFTFLIYSRTAPRSLGEELNISVIHNATFSDIRAVYATSQCAVIPLKVNRHASGLTVALESTAAGVPFVASAGGGLEEYFGESYCGFVSGDDVEDWSRAIDCAISPGGRSKMLKRSVISVYERELTNFGYGNRLLDFATVALARAHARKSKDYFQ